MAVGCGDDDVGKEVLGDGQEVPAPCTPQLDDGDKVSPSSLKRFLPIALSGPSDDGERARFTVVEDDPKPGGGGGRCPR